jgi:hypothetical protein
MGARSIRHRSIGLLGPRTVAISSIIASVVSSQVTIHAHPLTIVGMPVATVDGEVALAPPSCRIASDYVPVAFRPQYDRLSKKLGQRCEPYDERSTQCDQRIAR